MLSRFRDFWIGETYTYNNGHSVAKNPVTIPYIRHGWGQQNVLPTEVAVGQIISIVEVNWLIALINVSLYHIDRTRADLLIPMIALPQGTSTPLENITVDYAYYERIMSRIDFIESHKYDATNKVTGLGGIDIETTYGFSWTNDLTCVYSASWPSYSDARHYFNSGGTIWFELEADGGIWENIFNTVDTITIGADYNTTSGIVDSIIQSGFYSINLGNDWTTIFDVSGFNVAARIGEYGSEYFSEYGDYGTGEYSQRRLTIQGRCSENESTGEFTVEFRVILVEDDTEDTTPLVNSVAVTAGYEEIIDAPDFSSENPYYYTHNGSTYQFLQRTSPTMVAEQQWQNENLSEFNYQGFIAASQEVAQAQESTQVPQTPPPPSPAPPVPEPDPGVTTDTYIEAGYTEPGYTE